MRDIRFDSKFYYSQASLTAFEKCPLKFRLKYMEGINWKSEEGDEEFFFKSGKEFHLMAERYFSGIDINPAMINEEKQRIWIERLYEKIKVNINNKYFPEHEIRMTKAGMRIQGKYDLIVTKENGEIEIYDWKSEPVKLKQEKMEKKFQTLIYMYLVSESGIFGDFEEFEKITMYYWQPEYPDDFIKINYSLEKHIECGNKIKALIEKIEKYDFTKKDDEQRNKKNCELCEFKAVCRELPKELLLNRVDIDIEEIEWDKIEKINI